MTTLIDFTPTTQSLFTFQATLNGAQYNVAVPWNIFGERYYVSITDLSGTPVLYRALCGTGPTWQSAFTWSNGTALVTTQVVHNIPVGGVGMLTVTSTGTGFDGTYQALATGPLTLTYLLASQPATVAVTGNAALALNLVEGYNLGSLVFHDDTQQFEF